MQAAAAHLERLYPTLSAAFFSAPLPSKRWVDQVDPSHTPYFKAIVPPEKRLVQVDPAHAPGDFVPWRKRQEPLVVASPAAYLAPADLTPEALLTQSIVLLLLDEIEYQVAVHAVAALNPYRPSYEEYSMATQLWAMESGVALWQLWASDLPLAQWREPVVQWVFDATPLAPGQPYVEPAFAAELCAMHRLWMVSPIYLQLPFVCDARFEQSRLVQEWLWSRPRRSVASLPLTKRYITVSAPLVSTRAAALATMVEYAAATYGAERIPLLLDTMDKHGRWETLVIAVFGVSAEEFEAGWAAYLATHYGINDIY